jgi:hypothetical protein
MDGEGMQKSLERHQLLTARLASAMLFILNLISVPFQNNVNFPIGQYSRVQDVLNVQPVIPISLNEDSLEDRRSNWTSDDAPCAKYDSLRKPLLGNIGVKIDVNGPWADGFRRALRFWNTVLTANFHEEADLGACSVRIINSGPHILNHAIVARAQITEWANFQGKIAVNPGSVKEMSSAEIYAAAVNELGHMLGLKHNANIHSVMYFLDIDGTESLDNKDVLDLSTHHKLRTPIISVGFLPIQTVQSESAAEAKGQAITGSVVN